MMLDAIPEFRSGNNIPVERAMISRERMEEILKHYMYKPTVSDWLEALKVVAEDSVEKALILRSQGKTNE